VQTTKLTTLILTVATIVSCSNRGVLNEKNYSVGQRNTDSIVKLTNFDTLKIYSSPVCLQYKGRPLLTIGQNISALDTGLSFRPDPNLDYWQYWPDITDYLSGDDFYWVRLKTGSLNGMIYFSTDKKKRIFTLSGSWLFDIDINTDTKNLVLDAITTNLFPCIKGQLDFDKKLKTKIEHADFTETFELVPPDTTQGRTYNEWDLEYEVILK
jgi:hypothetical protein